jgi:hypothetical protein
MRKLCLSLLIVLNSVSQALAESPSLVDYLRKAPATVSGQIQFEAQHRIYSKGLVSSGIRKDKSIGFGFDEHHVELYSKNAIYVSVAGVPVNITKLTYDNRTGQITVKSDVLGTGLQLGLIEKKVREQVQRQFQPKLRVAFERLSHLREQRTLGDASSVLKEIAHAFDSDGPRKGNVLPSFRGDLTLLVSPVLADQTVKIGAINADIKKGDALQNTIFFRKPNNAQLQLKGFTFASSKGIRVREEKSSSKTIKAVTLNSVSLSEELGFQFQGTNVGDDVIDVVNLVGGALALADHGNMKALNDCQHSEVVQDTVINSKTRGKVINYVKEYRTEFLKAGATPELLRAIENTRES